MDNLPQGAAAPGLAVPDPIRIQWSNGNVFTRSAPR